MKHISVLAPQGAHIGMIHGTCDLLTEANDFLTTTGQPPLFNLQIVAATAGQPLQCGRFAITPDAGLQEVMHTDLIIIPASCEKDLPLNQDFLPWIVQQHQAGAETASLCTGAFLLASTGLLANKTCATHWMAAQAFKAQFPQVKLATDRIIVDEEGLCSSGGGYSYMNMVLYLIEKYAGREAAVHCAKVFQVDIHRNSQAAFIIFSGQKQHGDDTIRCIQQYIEQHYRERTSVAELASRHKLGRRSLELRFKKATGSTITEYMQRVKIEAAKKAFETSARNIPEVMYEVGYTDTKAFRTIFKRITGLSPIAYKNRYSQEAALD